MLLIFLGEYRQAIDKIVEAQLRRGMKYQPKKETPKTDPLNNGRDIL